MLHCGSQLVPLVQHRRNTQLRDAQDWQGGITGLGADGQSLLAGGQRRTQPPLRALHPAKVPADDHGQAVLPGRPDGAGQVGQGAFSLAEVASQPVRPGQIPLGEEARKAVHSGHPGQHLPGELDGTAGVAAQAGKVGPQHRDHCGHILPRRACRPVFPARSCLFLGWFPGAAGRKRPVGGVQPALERVGTAVHDRPVGLGDAQPRPVLDQPGGQGSQPPGHGRGFSASRHFPDVPLDHPGRPVAVPGGQGVPDRIVDQPVALTPGGRGAVQLRQPFRLLLGKAHPQQVGEQLVVAVPAAHLVQRGQEQIGPLDGLKQPLPAGAAGDRIAQRAAQTVQHRRLQQEGPHLLGLAVQHLLGQVIQHIAVAARKRLHKASDIRPPAQRQHRQLQPSHPPLRAGNKRRDSIGGQARPGRLAEQGSSLLQGEAQVGGAHLGQLAAGTQPRQRQRQVGAAGNHQPQPGRQMLEQEHNRLMHRLGVDQVVVVQHQHQLTRNGGKLVDQRGHHRLERARRRRAKQRTEPLADPFPHAPQSGGDMAPKPRRVVISGVQRQPSHRPGTAPRPVSQQRRLAKTSRSAHHRQPAREPIGEPVNQPRATHQAATRARDMQLRRQQRIQLRYATPGRGQCGRLTHQHAPPHRKSSHAG